MVETFPVLGEAPTSVEPGDGAFDDPALWQDVEALGGIGPFDDLDFDLSADLFESIPKYWSLVSAVGVEFQQERIHAKKRGHDQNATVAILNIRRMHDRMQEEPKSIYENMALLAFDLLAGVVPVRINPGPPFSALLTL